MSSFISFENVEKRYGTGEVSVQALHDASFIIEKGEICVIVGPSGAGKTTLLNILGGMDTLTSGQVFLDGREVSAFNSRQLADYRRRDIGFVFQFYNLIPNLTALENVEIASQIVKDPLPAAQVLQDVGLGERMINFRPSSPAASSSALPSPGLWPSGLSCCCAMSPPVRWTITPASRSWRFCRSRAAKTA